MSMLDGVFGILRAITSAGSAVPSRATLDFTDGLQAIDDADNGKTLVSLRADTRTALVNALTAGAYDGEKRHCDGYYARGDGGGGMFVWDEDNVDTAVPGMVIGTGTGRWLRVFDGPVNVRWFGAKGDGVTDDTASILAALDAGYADVFIPSGDYLLSATITVPQHANMLGAGSGLTILRASSVVGPVVLVGETGTTPAEKGRRATGKYTITGTATKAIAIDNCQGFEVCDIQVSDIYHGATFEYGAYFRYCWEGTVSGISTSGAICTAAHFFFGDVVNGTSFDSLYTGGGAHRNDNTAFLWDDTVESGVFSSGSTFTNLTAQSSGYGCWIKSWHGGGISGLYVEECRQPIRFGDAANSKRAINFTIENQIVFPMAGTPAVGVDQHPGYGSRRSIVDFDSAVGCRVRNINCEALSGVMSLAPVVFTGGGGSGAKAFARITLDGGVDSIEVLYGGTGYSSDPSVSVTGATGFVGVVTRSGTTVGSVAVSNAGSGLTIGDQYPLLATYKYAVRCCMSDVVVYGGTSESGHEYLWPLYPLICRTVGGYGYSGVCIENDSSWRIAGPSYSGETAVMRKSYGTDIHIISEHSYDGTPVNSVYTPPVYPA